MANYTKATNFTAKDGLPANNSGKIVKGAEIDTEFNAIAAAIASKADSNSPTLTGSPLAPTASTGTSNTQIATTAFVANAVAASYDSTNVAITGGSITGITDLAVADGGTGASTASGARTNLEVPSLSGTGATGTWAINISGNAANGGVTSVNGSTGAVTLGIPGISQTWQDVTSSRSAGGTVYQNTTGRMITVVHSRSNTDGYNFADVSVDNSTWVNVGRQGSGGAITFTVPNNHYYRITGGATVRWSELR